MYPFLSSANKCMVQSQQPTPSPLSQLPNTTVCLVCTIVPPLWLSGRFASLANGSGVGLPLTCRWFAYGQTLEIREEPACRRRRERGREKGREMERGKTVVRHGRQTAAARGTMFRFSFQPFCESGTDFWVGGDLITYAHSQLRVMLNPAALAQMTQNNTEQNIKENRAQNNTAKEITRVLKYNWSNRQRASKWVGEGGCNDYICTMVTSKEACERQLMKIYSTDNATFPGQADRSCQNHGAAFSVKKNSVTISVINQAREVGQSARSLYCVWFGLWRWEWTVGGENQRHRGTRKSDKRQRRLQKAKELWFAFWLAYWQRQTPSDWIFKSHFQSKWAKARRVAWVFITATKEWLFPSVAPAMRTWHLVLDSIINKQHWNNQ